MFFSLLVASSDSFSPSVMVDLNETDMLVGVTISINVSQYSLELCFFMIFIMVTSIIMFEFCHVLIDCA